jgi:hypothetical protein
MDALDNIRGNKDNAAYKTEEEKALDKMLKENYGYVGDDEDIQRKITSKSTVASGKTGKKSLLA